MNSHRTIRLIGAALLFGACVPDESTPAKTDAALGGVVASGGAGGSVGGATGQGGSSTGGTAGGLGSGGTSTGGATSTGGTKADAGTIPVISASCLTNCTKLPLAVDDKGHFVPSGYMGDWVGINEVSSETTPTACSPARAHDAAVGKCHHFTWKFSSGTCPMPEDPAQKCGQWACVSWLKPDNLYTSTVPGPLAGLPIAPGAKKVQFYAWAPVNTLVRFSVGAATEGVNIQVTAPLTPTPTKFELDISSEIYNVVNTGFGWCAAETGATGVDFYVDDIQWM